MTDPPPPRGFGDPAVTGPADDFIVVADSRPEDVVWPQLVWPDATTTLVHDRVVLRRATIADAVELADALGHRSVWEYLPVQSMSAEDWAETIATAERFGRYMWTVRDAAGAVVGTSSYLDVAPQDARLEIGWTAYAPHVWGSKVNPAAKLLLLGHAFEDLQAGRVQLKTDVRNVRSQQAIAWLGARHEGTLRRYQRRWDGTVRDTVLFAIGAEDWPRVRNGLLARLSRR